MTELLDFVGVVVPILEAGTWTNLGSIPKITVDGKAGPSFGNKRGNKNQRVEVKNSDGLSNDPDLAFDGTIIQSNLHGEISPVSTDKSKRNKMKTDIKDIIKAAGISATFTINDNPSKRNKDKATMFFKIIGC